MQNGTVGNSSALHMQLCLLGLKEALCVAR
jgi:hypothetical protein